MSTRITKLNKELLREVFLAWNSSAPRMFDEERSLDACINALTEELNSQWYALPKGAYMVLRNAVPGGAANVQFLTTDGKVLPALAETQAALVEAMREFRLTRLNIVVPTSTEWRDYKLLGFKHEGRIRKSVIFNGEKSDAEILGALEHEVGISRRRRRKRYRPNKKVIRPYKKVDS
jgi:hypothetical protein